jgi:hypothetical protein
MYITASILSDSILCLPPLPQDADSGVRDASSEAVASLAQGLYSLAGGPLPGSFSHPIVRLVFDCLGEQRKECQAAAGQALLMVRTQAAHRLLAMLRHLLLPLICRMASGWRHYPGIMAASE